MFSKETQYALRSLVYIQKQNFEGRKPGIDEIATETETPRFFIAKILQRLVRIGFLSSLKGKGGGFFFDKGKPELAVKELINVIDGNGIITDCGFGLKNCDAANPCPFHEQYAIIRDSIDKLVTNESIQSLAQKNKIKK